MINKYHTHSQTQAQHSIESHIFSNGIVTASSNCLDYKQTFIVPTRENYRRIKSALIDVANITLPPHLVSTLMAHLSGCDSLTFSSYRSVETLAKKTRGRKSGHHLSLSQTKIRNAQLVKLNWLHKGKPKYQGTCTYTVLLDNLYDHPDVLKRHKLLPGQNPGICGTRADIPPATPDTTTIVVSGSLQSIKPKEEISINTKSIKYDFFVEQNEPREPIPVAEFSARQSTREYLKRNLGHYSYDFVDECEKSFRMEPREQGIFRMPDEWNRKFNVYCRKSQQLKDARPSSKPWLPRWVRLTHNAKIHSVVHPEATQEYVSKEPEAPPISKDSAPPPEKPLPDWRTLLEAWDAEHPRPEITCTGSQERDYWNQCRNAYYESLFKPRC